MFWTLKKIKKMLILKVNKRINPLSCGLINSYSWHLNRFETKKIFKFFNWNESKS